MKRDLRDPIHLAKHKIIHLGSIAAKQDLGILKKNNLHYLVHHRDTPFKIGVESGHENQVI